MYKYFKDKSKLFKFINKDDIEVEYIRPVKASKKRGLKIIVYIKSYCVKYTNKL